MRKNNQIEKNASAPQIIAVTKTESQRAPHKVKKYK
jgi:hypothetical protein